MAFDKPTRNALAKMVGGCRQLLTEDIRTQLQAVYGLQPDGSALALESLGHLDESGRVIARELREWQQHLAATEIGTDSKRNATAFDRMAGETAFTVLNRLAALRMCEERGHVVECVRRGMESDGFQLYERLLNGALGTRPATYRFFLERMFEELAVDLGVLFALDIPQSLIFPSELCLEQVLSELNTPELAHLWKQDETIGWIYQYFNSKEEREAMREASAAPRNSRELAVRNQFFTPRYVVEFLVDNTLGRIWYEMRKDKTKLADTRRFLVRRRHPVFLELGQQPPEPFAIADWVAVMEVREMWTPPPGENADLEQIWLYAHTADGYEYSKIRFGKECGDLANGRLKDYRRLQKWNGSFEELRCCLYFEQRRWRHFGVDPEDTNLAEIKALYNAVCEQWKLEVEFIAHRPKKDPRDLKILDPACGSGHFLLYAFDLLETIYEEGWADEQQVLSEVTGNTLRNKYPDLDSLRRAIPELILRHNLHGIDIDLRACQIAALSLWLRAQHSYQRLGFRSSDRPGITRSNIVCAEPMPGEQELLDNFLNDLQPKAIAKLVKVVFEQMKLADEAGSLLKIEKEIADAVADAKEKWLASPKPEQGLLFGDAAGPQQKELDVDFSGVTDETFWERTEGRIYKALQSYSELAETGYGYQRRLFVDDTARGFAFIDLSRKRYDVVLMNPPFGASVPSVKKYLGHRYVFTKNDLYAAFVERGLSLLHGAARLGAITSRTGFFLGTFQDWREQLLLKACRLIVMADLGSDVLDGAMVEVASYVLENDSTGDPTALVFRLLLSEDKQDTLRAAVAKEEPQIQFRIEPSSFGSVDSSPFAYWIPNQIRSSFKRWPTFEPAGAEVRCGLSTNDNPRFVRAFWEVAPENHYFCYYPTGANRHVCSLGDPIVKAFLARKQQGRRKWAPHVMAGVSQPWFAPLTVVVNWEGEGAEIKAYARVLGNSPSRNVRSEEYYFRSGISWTRRAVRMIPYVIPGNAIPTASRYMAFPKEEMEALALGVMASNVASSYMRMFGEKFEFPNFLVDNVKSLPWPDLQGHERNLVEHVVREETRRRRIFYMGHEPFQEFIVPFSLGSEASDRLDFDYASLLGEELDKLVAASLGLTERELNIFQRDLLEGIKAIGKINTDETDDEELVDTSTKGRWAATMSYAIGCAFGRWDLRYATGEKPIPDLPDPFAPLPPCPPGMLQNEQGLPLSNDDVQRLQAAGQWHYSLELPWDGILVDDPDNAYDIDRRVREVLGVVWKHRTEASEQEACDILGVKGLRDYFRKPSFFFADHLKRYSKSRRQAPIYWPLSTPSGSYTLWIYYHRLNDDTLFGAVNKYIKPKTEDTERKIRQIESDLAKATGREASKRRDALEEATTLLSELTDFQVELLRVAELPYKPNLNDGVLITAAPLWKLFRLPKWRKDLQECWKKLEAGEYDWAHLAYSVWPDRVRDVCKRDRSIAIAHGLEELCDVAVKPTKKKASKKQKVEETVPGDAE